MLVEMSTAEIERCIERVVGVFSEALTRAKGWDEAEATEKARAHLALHLPADRAGHHFENVVSDGDVVGSIWFEEQPGQKRVYIFDIEVHEKHRGRGVGTAALSVLEERARELGAEEIALGVFAFNTGAIRLYERLGYEATETGPAGMQMAKRLSGH